MWWAISTHPDISRYCSAAKSRLLESGAQYYRCIQSEFGISLEVLADADYASKASDKRSVSGGEMRIMVTEKCVTLLISEAEYDALCDAVEGLLFLKEMWRATFHCSQGWTSAILNKPGVEIEMQCNSKHIDLVHHLDENINVWYVCNLPMLHQLSGSMTTYLRYCLTLLLDR